MLLAKCKCNRYQSRIKWPLVRFRSWYNCPCLSYYLLYRWCILLSQITDPQSVDYGRAVHDCHIYLFVWKSIKYFEKMNLQFMKAVNDLDSWIFILEIFLKIPWILIYQPFQTFWTYQAVLNTYPTRRYFLDHPWLSQDLKAGPWQIEIAEKMVKRLTVGTGWLWYVDPYLP